MELGARGEEVGQPGRSLRSRTDREGERQMFESLKGDSGLD